MYFKLKDKEKITNYYKKNGYVIIRNFFLKKWYRSPDFSVNYISTFLKN